MTHVHKCDAYNKNLWPFFKIHPLCLKIMVGSVSKVGFKTAATLNCAFTAFPLEKVVLQITFSGQRTSCSHMSKQDWRLFYECLCFTPKCSSVFLVCFVKACHNKLDDPVYAVSRGVACFYRTWECLSCSDVACTLDLHWKVGNKFCTLNNFI